MQQCDTENGAHALSLQDKVKDNRSAFARALILCSRRTPLDFGDVVFERRETPGCRG